MALVPLLALLSAPTVASQSPYTLGNTRPMASSRHPAATSSLNPFLTRPDECPPCFNCQLPAFNCANSGRCRSYDGQCDCPTGFGGQDCLAPLCGSPIKGNERFPREGEDGECQCDDGWGGYNCNVCQQDSACSNFLLGGERLGENGTCYTGGATVKQSFQQCDVTNKQITDMLPGRPPRVTFSCDKAHESCNFQVSSNAVLQAAPLVSTDASLHLR